MAYEYALLAAALNDARRIAIVGLSVRSRSPIHGVAVYLKCNGYPVIPVNPMYTEIFGTRSDQSVSDIHGGVDLVVVFSRPQDVPGQFLGPGRLHAFRDTEREARGDNR